MKALFVIASMALAIGCADSSKPVKKKGTPPASNNFPTSADASDEVCASLATHAAARAYAMFYNDLCVQGRIQALRSSATMYSGNGEPQVGLQAQQVGEKSQMQLGTSMRVPVDGQTYYNMMRLQIEQPDKWEENGFEFDKDAVYQKLATNGNQVTYHYRNDRKKPEVVPEYKAGTDFDVVLPGRVFVIGTRLTESIDIVTGFQAFQVIHDMGDGSAEVFSLSDQQYDNNNDHNSTVSEAELSFKQDMARAFRNASSKGRLANQYYP